MSLRLLAGNRNFEAGERHGSVERQGGGMRIFNSLGNCDKVRSVSGVNQTVVVIFVMLEVTVELTVVDPHVGRLLLRGGGV